MADCGKIGYLSKRHARLANRRNHHSLRFYYHLECGFWHSTKQRDGGR